MEKYTNPEQAVLDPSLAIITGNINSLNELNRIYFKYRALPKKQRRVSDYYSNELSGHMVPEMYYIVKDKLRSDGDIPFD